MRKTRKPIFEIDGRKLHPAPPVQGTLVEQAQAEAESARRRNRRAPFRLQLHVVNNLSTRGNTTIRGGGGGGKSYQRALLNIQLQPRVLPCACRLWCVLSSL